MTAVAYVLSLSLGAVATALAAVVLPHLFASDRFRKTNYRGRLVFAPGGMALAKALAVGTIVAELVGPHERAPLVMLGAGSVMGVLGFVDDVYGDRHAGGLFGHARALVRGRLTTGMVKAVGGALTGLASAYLIGWRGVWVLVAGAVIALAANLTNLLDLRPGRAIKVWVVAGAALLIVGVRAGGAMPLATMMAGVGAFAVPELREELMLGDTGANLLGTVIGVATIASVDRTGLLVIAAVLAGATLVSEVLSFTRVIEATPPLRWLDELGRRRS